MLLIFFNDTATTEIYTLSLHDALPILRNGPHPTQQPQAAVRRGVISTVSSRKVRVPRPVACSRTVNSQSMTPRLRADRKSTRLNSSHANISYAVFCLKKKKIYLSWFSA